MKPLNRPMFRYGGPIKEGIMSGMKDRPGYSAAGRVGGFLLNQIPKIKNFFKSQPSIVGSGTGIAGKYQPAPLTRVEKIKQFFQTAPAGKVIAQDPLVKFTTGSGTVASKFVKPVVKGALTTPTGLLTTAYFTDALPGGQPLFGTRNILGQKFDEETGIKTEGLFGRDLPAKKQLEEQRAKVAAQEEANKIIAQQQLEANKNKKLEKQDPKVFEDRKKYYYKLMGLDNMNKEAIYDSLIDASKIVGEQSSIKEGLKSGNLQTQIIDAISKNLDDQTKLKRQIDAAVLKGEIEKDIYQAKGGSSSEQLIKALAESGNLTEQEVARSRLGLPINVSQAIQVASAAKKGAPLTHDDVVLAATNFAALDNKPIKQQISSDEVKDKVGSGKQFANELAVVEAALGANPTAADDGFYIIGTKLIEVVKGKPIPRN